MRKPHPNRPQALLNSLYRMRPELVQELLSDVYTVGISYEGQGKYQQLTRRLRQKYIGQRRKMFDTLTNPDNLPGITESLVKHINSPTDQSVEPTKLEEINNMHIS